MVYKRCVLPRSWTMAAALAGALAAVPPAWAQPHRLTIDPPSPSSDDVVVVTVQQLGVCRVWNDGVQVMPSTDNFSGTVKFSGHTVPGPCTAGLAEALATQRVVLGRLPTSGHVGASFEVLGIADGMTVFQGGVSVISSHFPAVVSLTPALPSTVDETILGSAILQLYGCMASAGPPVVSGFKVTVPMGSLPIDPCPPFNGGVPFPLGVLAAGSYEVVDPAGDALGFFDVAAPASVLSLHQGRFGVQVLRPSGGTAATVALGELSGYFWFYDGSDIEVLIKILDGRAVNGHFWVFVASLTDRPFTLTVTDRSSCAGTNCATRVYTGVAGINRNFIDIAAFSGGEP
jgi:hypothetical protein